jgi:hypothetical protein
MPSATTFLSPSPIPNSGKACACEHHDGNGHPEAVNDKRKDRNGHHLKKSEDRNDSNGSAPVKDGNGHHLKSNGSAPVEEENIGDLNIVFGAVKSVSTSISLPPTPSSEANIRTERKENGEQRCMSQSG